MILKIHKVWHFTRNKKGLFEPYVNTWLKIKEEASGWPSRVGNDPIKQKRHLTAYEAKEGIKLDCAKIKKKFRAAHPSKNDAQLDAG